MFILLADFVEREYQDTLYTVPNVNCTPTKEDLYNKEALENDIRRQCVAYGPCATVQT